MSAHTTGCGDNSCVFKVLRTGSGMATNGGCRCFSALVSWNEAAGRWNREDVQAVQQDVQRLVVELRRARTSKADLLEALQDLTAQIMADWQADCTELLPESAEFKAALVAIAKAEGKS